MHEPFPAPLRAQLDALPIPDQLAQRAIADAHASRSRRAKVVSLACVVAVAAVAAPLLLSTGSSDQNQLIPAAPLPGAGTISTAAGTTASQPPVARRQQPVPGMTVQQAATLATRCLSWQNIGTAYANPTKGTVQVVARDHIGSTAIITAPIKSDAKPPAGYTPLPTHTLFVNCQLLPDGQVDTVLVQQLAYSDSAIPTPVFTETSGGGITRTAYTKETGDFNVPWLNTVGGRVSRDVARVIWTAPTGERVTANVLNGYFVARNIAPNGNSSVPTALVGYDRKGAAIYQTKDNPGQVSPPAQPSGPGISWP